MSVAHVMGCFLLSILTFNKFSDVLSKIPDAAGKIPRILLDVKS